MFLPSFEQFRYGGAIAMAPLDVLWNHNAMLSNLTVRDCNFSYNTIQVTPQRWTVIIIIIIISIIIITTTTTTPIPITITLIRRRSRRLRMGLTMMTRG
jgi:hypothetical protein